MNLDSSMLKLMIDAMEQGICLYDGQGRIFYCNDHFKGLYLNTSGQWEGSLWKDACNSKHHRISFLEEVLVSKSRISKLRDDGSGMFFIVTVLPLLQKGEEQFFLETIVLNPNQESAFEPGIRSVFESGTRSSIETSELVFSDAAMQNILETVHRISNFDSTILITGESGTGKSMLAKYIHQNSRRADGPFVTIDCATIPDNLIESELFGYVSGAFTGASQKGKPGMVELADKGTLFLDEIGLLPLSLQPKFLQLIQERIYMPIGALKSKSVDIRIISATNMDLKAQVQENRFREDLYYRLRVIELSMPPLRTRQDATEPLIDFFLQQFNRKYNINKTITDKAKEILKKHIWKGNIRELQYVMERIIATSPSNQITAEDIPPLSDDSGDQQGVASVEAVQFETEMDRYEYRLLRAAFEKHNSSYKVAKALGLTQSKASRLLRKHNIHS